MTGSKPRPPHLCLLMAYLCQKLPLVLIFLDICPNYCGHVTCSYQCSSFTFVSRAPQPEITGRKILLLATSCSPGKSPAGMPCTLGFAQALQEHMRNLFCIANFVLTTLNIDPKTNPKEAWVGHLSAIHSTLSNSIFDHLTAIKRAYSPVCLPVNRLYSDSCSPVS